MEFIAKYTGGFADSHLLPAYDGAISIQGISRCLTLTTHFLYTGKVRQRAPYDNRFQIFIQPPRAGSLEAIFQILSQPANLTVGGAIGVTVASNLISEFSGHIIKKVSGIFSRTTDPIIDMLENSVPGDIDALGDAIEPALRQAHSVIGNGVDEIKLQKRQTPMLTLDSTSKAYVNFSETSPATENMDVSVGSLNVNNSTGRVFFHDLGKTVPFSVSKEPENGTYNALTYSLRKYALGQPSDISIRFYRITAADGRTKKIIITSASRTID